MKKIIINAAISMMLILILILGASTYAKSIQSSLVLEMEIQLSEITIQAADRVAEKINNNFETLSTLSITAKDFSDLRKEEIQNNLREMQKSTSFSRLGYAKVDGSSITSDGEFYNISDREYFIASLEGRKGISNIIIDKASKLGEIIVLSVPVLDKHGMVEGSIFGIYEIKKMSDLAAISLYDSKGYACIIENDGKILVHPDKELIGKSLYANLIPLEENSLEKLKNIAEENSKGAVPFEIEGQKKYLGYAPISLFKKADSMYLITIIPYETAFKQSSMVMKKTIVLLIFVIAIGILTFGYIIRNKRNNKEKIEAVAYIDMLTGLRNYNGFIYDGKEKIKKIRGYSVLSIDIDNFRFLNDTYEYEYGNQVLKALANKTKENFRNNSVVARIYNDNFAVLIVGLSKKEVLNLVHLFFGKVSKDIEEIYNLKISLGIYNNEDGLGTIVTALDKANLAKKTVKGSKINKYATFDKEIEDGEKRERWLINELRKAIEKEKLEVYYQPKIDLFTNKIVSSEALVRWNHAEVGFISPAEFIPFAEKTQLIVNVGDFVLKRVCEDILSWQKKGLEVLTVAINLSRVELIQNGMVEKIRSTLAFYNIDPKLIEIEITETVAMNDYEKINQSLRKFKEIGIKISIDDFGSGYSSLSCLQNLPIDIIKIDRSILLNCKDDNKGIGILSGIILLSKQLGLQTICEGIETKKQLDLLINLNCDLGQGFLFNKPMEKASFEKVLIKQNAVNVIG